MAKKNEITFVEADLHERPWGFFENIREFSANAKLKILTVEAGHRLSYQSHSKRDEVWIPVSGFGMAIIDGESFILAPGTGITEINAGQKHQIDNRMGTEPLIIVEVQMGEACDEADIVRYLDDYGRSDES